MTSKASNFTCFNYSRWKYMGTQRSKGFRENEGTSELGGLLEVISSLILQMEELSPKEKQHWSTPFTNHGRTRSYASFW